jgi:hypothetical protein
MDLPKLPMSLESCDIGLTFQLKILEFMNSMKQDFQEGPIRKNG